MRVASKATIDFLTEVYLCDDEKLFCKIRGSARVVSIAAAVCLIESGQELGQYDEQILLERLQTFLPRNKQFQYRFLATACATTDFSNREALVDRFGVCFRIKNVLACTL